MNKANHIRQLEQEIPNKCSICKKAPIEIYQLDHEVCYNCWTTECFISFADQVDIPDV